MFCQMCKTIEEVQFLKAELDWWRAWLTEDFIKGEQDVGLNMGGEGDVSPLSMLEGMANHSVIVNAGASIYLAVIFFEEFY